jgi:hypothetical protein
MESSFNFHGIIDMQKPLQAVLAKAIMPDPNNVCEKVTLWYMSQTRRYIFFVIFIQFS